jgi:hypothetical protein
VLADLKPAVSRRTLLLTAALFWTAVGCLLLFKGGKALLAESHTIVLAAAILLGTVKGRFIFEKSAGRNVDRILDKKEGACLGAVFSYKAWGLILVMMFMGRLLRTANIPLQLYGLLVAAVGWGLLWSSRVFWRKWLGSAG